MKTKSILAIAVVVMTLVVGVRAFATENTTNGEALLKVQNHVHAQGFGRCSKCSCKSFEGRGQTCRNCGHAYKAHY